MLRLNGCTSAILSIACSIGLAGPRVAHASPVVLSWENVAFTPSTSGNAVIPAGVQNGSIAYVTVVYDPQLAILTGTPTATTSRYVVPGQVSVTIGGNQWSGSISGVRVTNDLVNPGAFGGPPIVTDSIEFGARALPGTNPTSVSGSWADIGVGMVGLPGFLASTVLPQSFSPLQLASVPAPATVATFVSGLSDLGSTHRYDIFFTQRSGSSATATLAAAPTPITLDTKFWAGWYQTLFERASTDLSVINAAIDVSLSANVPKAFLGQAASLAGDAALQTLSPYLGSTNTYLVSTFKTLEGLTKDVIGLSATAGIGGELKVAGGMAQFALDTAAFALGKLAADPPTPDYQQVLKVLGSIDTAALRQALAGNRFGTPSMEIVEAALKVIDGAIVALSAAERSPAAFAAGDAVMFLAQQASFAQGLDQVRSATVALGLALERWNAVVAASGVLNGATASGVFDFSSLTGSDEATIRAFLSATGLFDQIAIDFAIRSVRDLGSWSYDQSTVDLSSIAASLTAAPSLRSAAPVNEPPGGIVLACSLAALLFLRRRRSL